MIEARDGEKLIKSYKMSSLFACPPPTALATVPTQACPERFDQIIRFFFQRKQATPSFTASTIKVAATWTPLLTAVDSTKIIGTPLIPNVVIPTGEIKKEGGDDNTTINGIPKLVGRGHVGVTAQLNDIQATVRAALRALASESALSPGFTNLWMYAINRSGQIIANSDGSGIDVYNVYAGDVGSEGLNKANIANFAFDLAPGWSDNVAIFDPTAPFNPLNL
jgi:hypothetical protein